MAVLSLPVAKSYLNISGSASDTELTAVIASAESAIARHVGPLEPTAVTARVSGGTALVLPRSPAVSLTSVTPVSGSALSLADLYLSTAAAVVSYNSGASFDVRAYDVVYTAGRATCPDDLLLAVKELVRHLWDPKRGPTKRPGSSTSDATANTVPGAAYMMPFRVAELIAPHMQPGFA